MKKITIAMLTIVAIVAVIIILSPSSLSTSNDPCARCHNARYNQYLDILEDASGTQVPTTLSLGQTKTVSVVIQNDVNTATYATLTSVSATLSSSKGHFSVSNPTYNIGNLQPGTAVATWQITAVSDGYDTLTIQATAFNTHFSCYYSDSYSPPVTITVGQPTPTPIPTATPTPTETNPPTNPPATSTPSTSTPTPAATSTPTTTPTASPSTTPTTPGQTELSIQLLSPKQNQKLTPNTSYEIEWQTTGGTSPFNVTLAYASENDDGNWINIATNLPANGKHSWITPAKESEYRILVSVQDSSQPIKATSTIETVQVGSTTNPELPIIPIATALVIIIVVILVFILLRVRRKKPT